MGAVAITRLSATAVSQLVQPRFDAPVMTKPSTGVFHSAAANSSMASMAFTALLTMGKSSGHVSSPVSR